MRERTVTPREAAVLVMAILQLRGATFELNQTATFDATSIAPIFQDMRKRISSAKIVAGRGGPPKRMPTSSAQIARSPFEVIASAPFAWW